MPKFSFTLIGLIFLLSGCITSCSNHSSGRFEGGGIAISFDDRFIDEWYELRPLFQKYGAKVTFFITCHDSLTSDEIHKLKMLESDGHEIGFHGTIHGKSTELIKMGEQSYEDIELKPGLESLKSAGFHPTSYAHPGGNHNDQVDEVLLKNGFTILRDVAVSRRVLYGIPLYTIAPKRMNWIYYGNQDESIVDALLIDYGSGTTAKNVYEAIQRAKNTGTVLMLFGHKPLASEPSNGEYGFSIHLLEEILQEAHRENLQFFRMNELRPTK